MMDKEGKGKKIDDGQRDCHCPSGTLVLDAKRHLHPSSKVEVPLLVSSPLWVNLLRHLNAIPSSCPYIYHILLQRLFR